MIYIAIIALVMSVGLTGYCTGLLRRVKALEDRVETLHQDDIKTKEVQFDAISRLTDSCAKLEKTVGEIPIAKMEDEVSRMTAWNDGIESIMNFSPEIPKLNAGGIKHG